MRQCMGMEWANVTGHDCCGCQARILTCLNICQASHNADEKPSRLAIVASELLCILSHFAMFCHGSQGKLGCIVAVFSLSVMLHLSV